jgi:N-acetylglucosamine kinase-like BadF-type ATPase
MLFLGIDGGESKTRGVLINDRGELLAQSSGFASAISGSPSKASIKILAGLIDDLCEHANTDRSHIHNVCIGLNGVDFRSEFAIQHAGISDGLQIPPQNLILTNDGISALWSVSSSRQALILQIGSGFTSAYRTRFGDEKLFDHLNIGENYDIRKSAIKTVARMIDGRIKETQLKHALLEYLKIPEEHQFAEIIFQQEIEWDKISRIISVVVNCWRLGDPEATRIVNEAADDYALTACNIIPLTGCITPDVSFGGGVITYLGGNLWQMLAERINKIYPQANVIRPGLSPELGSALHAAFQSGFDPQTMFQMMHYHWTQLRTEPVVNHTYGINAYRRNY